MLVKFQKLWKWTLNNWWSLYLAEILFARRHETQVRLFNIVLTMVPTKKKMIRIPGLSRTFFQFFQDFLHQSSRTFPALSTEFQDFPGLLPRRTNSNNKISSLQNKNIHPVVYINNSSFYSNSKNKFLS